MTQGLDETQRSQVLDALGATLVDHDTGDRIHFGSVARLIAARRPAR